MTKAIPTKNDLRLINERLEKDFAFFAEKCLKVVNKDGSTIPFKLNRAQKRLLAAMLQQLEETGRIRVCVLKGRQMGISTFFAAWFYWLLSRNQGQKALVMAHVSKASQMLLGTTKNFHDNVPDFLRPSTSYRGKNQLTFDKLMSEYLVETAGNENAGRGHMIRHAHLSELAFWPVAHAEENMVALQASIPPMDGTCVAAESTANGNGGAFHKLWTEAVAGENGYLPVFLPWHMMPEYREPVPAGFERTDEEREYVARVDKIDGVVLDDEQLQWRRMRIAAVPNGYDKFKQEYPCCPEEAFLNSGRPVFDKEQINNLLLSAPAPIARQALGLGEKPEFEDHAKGELLIYHDLDPFETYEIGGDVAMGLKGGDYSVAQVLDSKRRQVAVWRGRVHPDSFAHILAALGRKYNNARIAVEVNNHGLTTLTVLEKVIEYPKLYYRTVYDKKRDEENENLGFQTNMKTKPLIINRLIESLRKSEIEINDEATLKEMLNYIVVEGSHDKFEADAGCHDDCVMSLAIVNFVLEPPWHPFAMRDDYYTESL